MKLIFTSVLLTISLLGHAAGIFGDSIPVKNKPAEAARTGITAKNDQAGGTVMLRCGGRLKDPDILLVIDGVPAEYNKLQFLNPHDIASIEVLKEDKNLSFSCRRNYSGVILITTKSALVRKFIIKDFLTGQPVPGATVSFLSESDTLRAVANDSGILVMKNLKTGLQYSAVVSSAGYKTVSAIVKGKEQEILLERDVKLCPEVVVIGYPGFGCGRSYTCIYTKTSDCEMSQVAAVDKKVLAPIGNSNSAAVFSVYPNPVRRSNTFNLAITAWEDEILQLSVTGLDGKLVWQQSQRLLRGVNRFAVITDTRWTAGVYIIQLRDNRGKVVKTEKLVIQ